MMFPAQAQQLHQKRDSLHARSAEQFRGGHDEHANRNADAADRITRKLDRHYAERDATLVSLLDHSNRTDEQIRDNGGLVVYCRGIRVVGLTADQAGEQYRRVRAFLQDFGIPNEMVEWYVRDVFHQMVGAPPTERTRA
jgi:hypothetical protein